ncbi:MAG: FKBP-type peptidyl-prolyl cis-trans isomerase [Bacteroidia bacterium]|jgi:FKBP-type peptidyl-prolyl cis-trans isomerase|nr:FKBP-type peptidyl-prolyl cis-trans isomerase [Bacteroidia bacterium]
MKRIPALFTLVLFVALSLLNWSFAGKDKGKQSRKFLKTYQQVAPATWLKMHKAGPRVDSAGMGGVAFMKLKLIDHRDSLVTDFNAQRGGGPVAVQFDKPRFKGDFLDMLSHLNVGDSATFYIVLDSIKKYYRSAASNDFPLDPKNDSLEFIGFRVKIDSVYTKSMVEMKMAVMQREKQAQQQALIEKSRQEVLWYLAVNEMSDLKPDSKGIYYKELVPGTGAQVTPGTKVSVWYRGMLTNGLIFDTNLAGPQRMPMEFIAGQQMITGFTECILRMKDGGKSLFIIPPELAYGEQQNGAIPPYSALVFVVELKIVGTGN